jgi:hypothetical protein
MTKKMSRNEYLKVREFYRAKGQELMMSFKPELADYYVGVVRGLDLAFGEGSAKTILE